MSQTQVKIVVILMVISMLLWGEELASSEEKERPASVLGDQLFGQTVYQGARAATNKAPKLVLKHLDEESHPGIENLIQITPELYSGAQPMGKQGFRTLQKLGIRTIVSVDGAFPQVKQAELFGLAYVHIPITYGEVSDEALLSILHAEQALEKPVFVHCHHGKHRGPAAAALLTMMSGTCGKTEAEKILKLCGTSKNYSGLWESVRSYELPDPGISLPPLMSLADFDPIIASMVQLDEIMEKLAFIQEANWKVGSKSSEKTQTELTVLLHEELREYHRLAPPDRPELFTRYLDEILKDSKELTEEVNSRNTGKSSELMKSIKQNCRSCHRKFRD